MRRRVISAALVTIDAVIVAVTPFISMLLYFEGFQPYYFDILWRYLPAIIFLQCITFYSFGLYRRLWRYASINELLAVAGAVTACAALSGALINLGNVRLPYGVFILNWYICITFVGLSRLCIRIIHHLRKRRSQQACKVLIIGAGDAGAMIAREIHQRYYGAKRIVGFVDDDKYKHDQMLFGYPVLGNRDDIKQLVSDNEVEEIIIAMPSVGGGVVREIYNDCRLTGCKVKILPGIYELIDGKVTIQQLRDVDLEDLLRREPVKLDLAQIASHLSGKCVLVTGAGGSIGSELCRQIARLSPKRLVLVGRGENSIYEINREISEKFPEIELDVNIADIRDADRMAAVFAKTRPHVVFHAAAHKHVPLMEMQPGEAIKNNIFGTKIVAEAADHFGAQAFVMISTDKAVNPTSVMGVTKRIAELVVCNMNKKSATKFVAVRFGNVLGSRGSVIPLFKQQIAQGGPITITHPDMRRYFMTIPEASQLVLQAGAMAQGGEVFVLDMGEPVKIVDMAADLIELSGFTPHKDIKIVYTGLRPGEKLFEELLTAEEGTMATKNEKIFVANLREAADLEINACLEKLQKCIYSSDKNQTLELFRQLVPTYHYQRNTCGSRLAGAPGKECAVAREHHKANLNSKENGKDEFKQCEYVHGLR